MSGVDRSAQTRQVHIKSPRIHQRIQLAVGDMTMSGWKPIISLIHPPPHYCGPEVSRPYGHTLLDLLVLPSLPAPFRLHFHTYHKLQYLDWFFNFIAARYNSETTFWMTAVTSSYLVQSFAPLVPFQFRELRQSLSVRVPALLKNLFRLSCSLWFWNFKELSIPIHLLSIYCINLTS